MDDGYHLELELGRRRTAADMAFSRLRKAIIDGELKPDERLTEIKLAESLRISRTPLRNALQRLEAEGWIRRTSTGGIRVGGVSESEIDALYDVRSSLEALAIRKAIGRLTEAQVVELHSNLADQKRALEANNISLAGELSELFHRQIWQASDDHVCLEFLESINARTKRYRRIAFRGQANIYQGVAEHERIMDRLDAGDSDGAIALITSHIEHSRNAVKLAFRNWERGVD